MEERICPVTGKKTVTLVPSKTREGVMISPSGVHKESSYGKWWVDTIEVTKELEMYIRLRNDYDILKNFSNDQKIVARMENRLFVAESYRNQKYVVYINTSDGVTPLAEFEDINLARARVFGWLDGNYTTYGNNTWMNAEGIAIGILYL